MHIGGILGRALVALFAFAATAATAAENLDCISEGYDAAQASEVAEYQASFRAENAWAPELPQTIIEAISGRAGQCAEQHGWSPEAIEDAVFFRMFSVMRGGVVQGTPFSPTQMQRVDQVIAGADQARLGALIGRMMDSTMNAEEEADVSEADNVFLGRLILRAGVPATETNASFFGTYLGAVVMPRMLAERFATR